MKHALIYAYSKREAYHMAFNVYIFDCPALLCWVASTEPRCVRAERAICVWQMARTCACSYCTWLGGQSGKLGSLFPMPWLAGRADVRMIRQANRCLGFSGPFCNVCFSALSPLHRWKKQTGAMRACFIVDRCMCIHTRPTMRAGLSLATLYGLKLDRVPTLFGLVCTYRPCDPYLMLMLMLMRTKSTLCCNLFKNTLI